LTSSDRLLRLGSVAKITLGRGKNKPVGVTVELDETNLPLSLAVALVNHDGPGGWVACAEYRESRRRGDHWLSQQVVAIDVDYHLEGQHHARGAACDGIDLSTAPCALAHWTPRGLRLFFCLDRPLVDRDAYGVAWSSLSHRIGAWLPSPTEGELVLDTHARDLARFLWTPRATVDGVERDDAIVQCSELATELTPLLVRPLTAITGGRDAVARARAWLAKADVSIDGAGGHDTAMRVVERVVRGFGLDDADAMTALAAWNARCQPPWSDVELLHKIQNGRIVGDTPKRELLEAKPASRDTSGLIWHDGKLAKIASNVAVRLRERSPRWDRFTQRVVMTDGQTLTDEHEVEIQGWLWSSEPKLQVGIEEVHRGVLRAAHEHSYDSLTEFVEGLPVWDGTCRLSTWLTVGLGADDTSVTRMVARAWMISCVARALKPGCVADGVLILEGAEGIGKNRAIETVFGSDPYVRSLGTYRPGIDAQADVAAATSWVVHYPELNLAKQNVDRFKDWVTCRESVYRAPYARNWVTLLRRAVLVASTNDATYLADGANRRFWPVLVRAAAIGWLTEHREQLLAEALAAFRAGESYLVGVDNPLLAELSDARQAKVVEDGMCESVRVALCDLGFPEKVRGDDVWRRIGVQVKDRHGSTGIRFGEAMRKSGYDPITIRINGVVSWGWKKK
jgi:hypothetical protein